MQSETDLAHIDPSYRSFAEETIENRVQLDTQARVAQFRTANKIRFDELSCGDQNDVLLSEMYVRGSEVEEAVRVVVYQPAKDPTCTTTILFLHGGGMIVGTPEGSHSRCLRLARKHKCNVVAVDYAKAPENPWPSGVLDAHRVLEWLSSDASKDDGLNSNRIALYGESGGGGIAAALAVHARNQGSRSIQSIVLGAPMLDDRTDGQEVGLDSPIGRIGWGVNSNSAAWKLILADGADQRDCEIPARVSDLSGLPPTFVYVSQYDLFLHEDLRWVAQLSQAGVAAELYVVPGAFHGFELLEDTKITRETFARIDRYLSSSFTSVAD